MTEAAVDAEAEAAEGADAVVPVVDTAEADATVAPIPEEDELSELSEDDELEDDERRRDPGWISCTALQVSAAERVPCVSMRRYVLPWS